MKNKMMVLVVLLVVALLLSGCDDDDGSTPAPTAAPEDTSLVELADDTRDAVEKGQSNACKVCLWAEDPENCTGVCGAVKEGE